MNVDGAGSRHSAHSQAPHWSTDLHDLQQALDSGRCTSGSTHNFYLYPARFSPEVARSVIETFSDPGDCVLDPFMGGGTSVIEALTLGRSVIGADLNSLAHFVSSVRTRPLSACDENLIQSWADRTAEEVRKHLPFKASTPIKNLRPSVTAFMSVALNGCEHLVPRQHDFARAVLLRLGQWAVDCRDHTAPSYQQLSEKLPDLARRMLGGLREFVEACRSTGTRKNQIVRRRLLICRNAVGLDEDPLLQQIPKRPRLVLTSPPYPRVHVLYHRWQIRGRKETPAPYWIAQLPDGHYASHYTGGSRTPTGERNYFTMITSAFSSIRRLISDDGLVVQLVGFADAASQLPMYFAAMRKAGFVEWLPAASTDHYLSRRVPNRKWHAKLSTRTASAVEFLLIHRPCLEMDLAPWAKAGAKHTD
jgi:hypothetical protein